MSSRDITVHIFRTVILVLVLAAIFIGILVGGILLKLPIWLIFTLLIAFIVAIVWGTARWHAYWAPIAKQAARVPWERSDGTPMETVIENALVQGGFVAATETLRVSIYELEFGPRAEPGKRLKRIKRIMIGDAAELLAICDRRLWFYIYDRFHARRDGLVCLDAQTGAWLYHRPQAEIEYVDHVKKRRAVIEVKERGRRHEIDLATEPLDTPPPVE